MFLIEKFGSGEFMNCLSCLLYTIDMKLWISAGHYLPQDMSTWQPMNKDAITVVLIYFPIELSQAEEIHHQPSVFHRQPERNQHRSSRSRLFAYNRQRSSGQDDGHRKMWYFCDQSVVCPRNVVQTKGELLHGDLRARKCKIKIKFVILKMFPQRYMYMFKQRE